MNSGTTPSATRPETPPIRVLVADDHPLIRSGLAAVFATTPDMVVAAEASDGASATARYAEVRPDVVLMDLRMPGVGGVEATSRILAADPDARVLVLTTYDGDADIRRALDAGARGYLLKDMLGDEVVVAVRAVHAGARAVPEQVTRQLDAHAGEPALTEREVEVLGHVARGLSNKEVAREIGRTQETVKMHLKHVFEKLGVGDRVAAVAAAVRRGLVRLR